MSPTRLRDAAFDLRGRAAEAEGHAATLGNIVGGTLADTAWHSAVADETRHKLHGGSTSAAARLRAAATALRRMAGDLEDRALVIDQEAAAVIANAEKPDALSAATPGPTTAPIEAPSPMIGVA